MAVDNPEPTTDRAPLNIHQVNNTGNVEPEPLGEIASEAREVPGVSRVEVYNYSEKTQVVILADAYDTLLLWRVRDADGVMLDHVQPEGSEQVRVTLKAVEEGEN